MSVWTHDFGALEASLRLSWSLFESSWSLFGGSWMGLRSSSGALGDALGLGEPLLYFHKMNVSFQWEHDVENLYYQGTGSELQWDRMFGLG